jgi:3-deoxy-D-manno-octulosonate 8-phosphate phosphatase (KDO 8-P phosphatase)
LSDRNKALDKAARVKLAVFDVDGVLTDGRLVFTDGDEEQKIFHVHDGLGLKMLKASGCDIAIISSRSSAVVCQRMAELGIDRIFEGQDDKRKILMSIMNELNLERSNVVFTGDDLVDLPAMKISGMAIAVANAHPLVKKYADWTTDKEGGAGAVREICEMILSAQGKLEAVYDDYLI